MKNLITYKDFLFESQLNEIGDSSLPPYEWQLTTTEDNTESFEFQVEDFRYDVTLSPFKNGVNVSFSANGNDKITTNQGKQYRIMSTVIDIVKDHLKRFPNIYRISFIPNEDFINDERRLKLYIAYIKKQFAVDNVEIEQLQNNKVIEVTLKR
jgi:hypothetical protein